MGFGGVRFLLRLRVGGGSLRSGEGRVVGGHDCDCAQDCAAGECEGGLVKVEEGARDDGISLSSMVVVPSGHGHSLSFALDAVTDVVAVQVLTTGLDAGGRHECESDEVKNPHQQQAELMPKASRDARWISWPRWLALSGLCRI